MAKMEDVIPDWKKRLTYAFGHLVGSLDNPYDAHSADSADLAFDTLDELAMTDADIEIVETLAEHVAGNYQWTGADEEIQRKIEAGEV